MKKRVNKTLDSIGVDGQSKEKAEIDAKMISAQKVSQQPHHTTTLQQRC